jgi:protein AaeX
MALRWLAVEAGWARQVWHPALFEFSVFLIVLAAAVLTVSHLRIFG